MKLQALVFDAYGTLFDVHSVGARCEQFWPGKGAPQVYQHAVERLGVAAGAIGFVSSNCWDALGAKAFGFNVYWINRGGTPVDHLGLQPDGMLGSLGDLPERIAN